MSDALNRRAFAKHAALLALAAAPGCSGDATARAQVGKRPPSNPATGPKLGLGAGLGGRRVFPPDNPWNRNVSTTPVDPHSMAFLARVGLEKPLHPDFGAPYQGKPNGIPYVVVPGDQPRVPVTFGVPDESDPGPYPVPPDAPIEGGPDGDADRHVLVIDRDRWRLYELFSARPERGGASWTAGSGAIFDLNTGEPRPAGWTSADAAGLPIFPGLVRYEEVALYQMVRHAFRFTVVKTQRGYVAPARHFASPHVAPDLPPMGMRVRLKASYDLKGFPPQSRVILQALKSYGMILADNGSDWFLSGAPDPRWDDEDLGTLKRVKVRDFEVVRMGEVVRR